MSATFASYNRKIKTALIIYAYEFLITGFTKVNKSKYNQRCVLGKIKTNNTKNAGTLSGFLRVEKLTKKYMALSLWDSILLLNGVI